MRWLLSNARGVAKRIKKAVVDPVRMRTVRAKLNVLPALPKTEGGKGHILFFTPEGSVTAHLSSQCILARTLADLGHSVLMVRCFGLYERCPVMDMKQLPYTNDAKAKEAACLECASNHFSMIDRYGLPVLAVHSPFRNLPGWPPDQPSHVVA